MRCFFHLHKFGQLASLYYICSAILKLYSTSKSNYFISALESQVQSHVQFSTSAEQSFPPPVEMLPWICYLVWGHLRLTVQTVVGELRG
jgi:hypothetical protein